MLSAKTARRDARYRSLALWLSEDPAAAAGAVGHAKAGAALRHVPTSSRNEDPKTYVLPPNASVSMTEIAAPTKQPEAFQRAIRPGYRWAVCAVTWAAFALSLVDRLAWGNLQLQVGPVLGLPLAGLGIFVRAFFSGYVCSNA